VKPIDQRRLADTIAHSPASAPRQNLGRRLRKPGASSIAVGEGTDLARPALQFRLIDRTACYHPDRRTRGPTPTAR